MVKNRLANLTLGNSGKRPGTNGWLESAKLNSEMTESLESWRCAFPGSKKIMFYTGLLVAMGIMTKFIRATN